MDCVSSWVTPPVELILVDEGIATLEVLGVLQQGVVLGSDVFLGDFLLNNFLAPVVVQPGMHHALLICRCFQKGILRSNDVKIDSWVTVKNFLGVGECNGRTYN